MSDNKKIIKKVVGIIFDFNIVFPKKAAMTSTFITSQHILPYSELVNRLVTKKRSNAKTDDCQSDQARHAIESNNWEASWRRQRQEEDIQQLSRALTSPALLLQPNEFGLRATLNKNAEDWFFVYCDDRAFKSFLGIPQESTQEMKAVMFLQMQMQMKLSHLIASAGMTLESNWNANLRDRLNEELLERYPYLEAALNLVKQHSTVDGRSDVADSD